MPSSTTRILVTGATGFLGSHLTRKLLKNGYHVGLIKRRNSNVWRISDLVSNLAVYPADIKDFQEVKRVIADFQPEIVYHLAAYYSAEPKPKDLFLMFTTNVLGTINLLEACQSTNIKRFTNTSSGFVYGDYAKKIKENEKLRPVNFYALTKMQSEEVCTFYARKHGFNLTTFRIFPPFGPADNERRLIPYIINSFLKNKRPKLTTGKQRWDFIYVDDVVEAYLKLLNISEATPQHDIFNIGTGRVLSIRQIVGRIKKIMDAAIKPDWGAIPHRENEVWFLSADISNVKKKLKWKPKVQILNQGLESTINWYSHFGRRAQ